MEDFNGNIGNSEGQGVPGNHKDINKNDEGFLDFLKLNYTFHVN